MGAHEVAERIDAFVGSLRGSYTLPGLALAVTDRDGLLVERVYGHADVAAGEAVTPDTLFQIGSIGKSFTACCALRLVEEGRLDLHGPVTTYLPWFEVRSRFEPITLHHLLTHTAGIVCGSDITSNSLFEVWALRDTETGSAPGSVFHYSNVGYRVIGAVLEAVEGRPYPDILRDRVLDVVGMPRTEPVISTAMRSRLATGYGPWPDDRPALPSGPMTPAVWFETGTADGSVASTASDMAAYLRMLMNRGRTPTGRVLSDASFEAMAARAVPTGDDDWYGYALERVVRHGDGLLGHGGSMVGYVSSMYADEDAGLGAVVLVNGVDWGEATEEVAWYAIGLARAAAGGGALPDAPQMPSLTEVDGADRYAGMYRHPSGATLELLPADDGVAIRLADGTVAPAYATPGASTVRLIVPYPGLDRFAVTFEEAPDGPVLAACHGPSRFARDGSAQPDVPEDDPGLDRFVGHYESSNPWTPHLRVVQRAGRLVLCHRSGMEVPLVRLGEATFGIDGGTLPERLRFDAVVDGRTLRADLSGCAYYRSLEG